jgi:hypothetical protein
MSSYAARDSLQPRTGAARLDVRRMARAKGRHDPQARAAVVTNAIAADDDLGRGHAMAIMATLRGRKDEDPMPKRLRLTRRFPVAMTEDGYRRLKRFATEAGLDEGEALSFLFENFSSVINEDNLTHRMRLFNAELEDRKK